MTASFEGRHVVVTGGTGALGSAIVSALAAEGAICHIPAHGPALGGGTAPANPKIEIKPGIDLTDEAAVERFYGAIPSLWASIHVAGGFAAAGIADAPKAALMAQIEMNFVTCYLSSRAAVMAMRKTGAGGRIVNVASRQGLEWRLGAGLTAYAASKAAVAAFTAGLAQEVAADGILVNAVAPSTIDTPANRQGMPKADFASWPRPEEIALTVLHLASPQNGVTRGAVVPVYGRS
jgi:NAD(P)-dependent dehydrogenase (short-subunit alcohol dehydrogenase family)